MTDNKNMDERKLVSNCQKGDAQAFGQIYEVYFEKIYKFIYYKVSHQETAEDLTSLCFTKALENMGSFDNSKGYFSAWLYKIARNCVIDHYRTDKKTQDIEQSFGIYSDDNIEKDMSNKQQLSQITEKLDQLKPEQKEIIMMRVWDELSYKEISQIVNKSEASCKMSFSRSIKQLKTSLAVLVLLLTVLLKF